MLEQGRLREVAIESLGAFGFCTNLVLYFRSSIYLSGVTLPSPLQHFWSLAVEEQFYVVWPLLLAVVFRIARQRWRLVLSTFTFAAVGASLFASILVTRDNPSGGYYFAHTRAWEILIGAGLAMMWTRAESMPSNFRSFLGWCGIAAILWSAFTFDSETLFPGFAAMVPVFGAVGVLVSADCKGGTYRLLSVTPARWLGARSYSLYLWHWPALVLVEARFGTPSMAGKGAVIAACIALSAITYAIIEQPFRRSQWISLRPLKTITAGLIAVSVALGGAGLTWAIAPSPVINVVQEDTVKLIDSTSTSSVPNQVIAVPDTAPVKALLLGDSVLAGLRWWEEGTKSLIGFNWVLDAEPCRRLLYYSCLGREERNPPSAVGAFRKYKEKFDVVVVLAGYHSRDSQFEEEVTSLLDEIRATGAKVVFLSLKETLAFPAPGSRGKKSMYVSFNKRLSKVISERNDSGVVLADWNFFSRDHREWFRSDNMHTSLPGTLALGWFISHAVATATNHQCPSDARYPCSIPDAPPTATDWLSLFDVVNTRIRCFEMGAERTRLCKVM
jgi:peptidoglycan/LPS O-acetylase OafA/YrhL